MNSKDKEIHRLSKVANEAYLKLIRTFDKEKRKELENIFDNAQKEIKKLKNGKR